MKTMAEAISRANRRLDNIMTVSLVEEGRKAGTEIKAAIFFLYYFGAIHS
jgi:hypothetical protein